MSRPKQQVFIIAHKEDHEHLQHFESQFSSYVSYQHIGQNEVSHATSVLCVLYGQKTRHSRDVLWNMHKALSREHSSLCGLIGILLPTFPVDGEGYPQEQYLHPLMRRNVRTGYADCYFWPPRTRYNRVSIDLATDIAAEKRLRACSGSHRSPKWLKI